MALRGNLKDFSLPDVFQLITFSRKTGVLHIQREDGADGSVWFRDGDVFFAQSNWHSEPLGERLVAAQRITPQALSRVLELRAAEPAEGRRIGHILMDEGYITEKVLEAFVSEQIQDTIFDLMRWDEGDFDFKAMPEAVEEDIGLSVSIENIVMEGSRRLEEWNRIRKKIPSMDVVFKMATAPGEGTFEISLKPMEWQLLLLVDASRSVAELATETGRTDFDVARIIYGLFSAGLLEFAADEEVAHSRAERAQRDAQQAELDAARLAEQPASVELPATSAEPPAPAAEAPYVAAAAAVPAEEPSFLGLGQSAPTDDDVAVLEQFMGAVLEQPVAEPAPAPEPQHEEYLPQEEPPFVATDHEEEAEGAFAVPSVEDLLGIAEPFPGLGLDAGVAEQAPAEPAFDLTPAREPVVEPVIEPAPEPMFESAPEPAAAFVPQPQPEVDSALSAIHDSLDEEPVQDSAAENGFERDLMALGLGELPTDLLQPAAEEPALREPQQDFAAAPAAEAVLEPIVEPMSQGGAATPATAPDFSDLLESLDVDVVPATQEAPVAEGFDVDLLLEDEPAQGGVISTDAFLDDISMEDMQLGGSMGDELSALTGAERRVTSARPQASVNAIPEPGAGALRRDARVDKDTVLKIIDGIKKL